MLGVKQEYIANELNMTQQAVSKLEQKENIEDEILERVSKVLNIPLDAIKNLNEDATTNYINTFYNTNSVNFNPIEKVVELYERLLASEREKVELLKQLGQRRE